jgi:dTDP-4-dehydrorhamnose 3,5-epimerase
MKFSELRLRGAFVTDIEKHTDERGFFARTWDREEYRAHGLATGFTQCSLSYNEEAGTIRGLHFQRPPHAEVKIVQCLRGAIYDVIVDLRAESETFGQWTGLELSADDRRVLYIPERFAHGFQTLQPRTEVGYMISEAYVPEAASGVRYDDPGLAIDWPLPVSQISARDRTWPGVKELSA